MESKRKRQGTCGNIKKKKEQKRKKKKKKAKKKKKKKRKKKKKEKKEGGEIQHLSEPFQKFPLGNHSDRQKGLVHNIPTR